MGKDPKIKGQATARPVATAAPAPAKPTLTIENAANWTPGEISRAMDVEPSGAEYDRIVQIVRQTKKDAAMFGAADSGTTAKESARLRIMEAIDELTSMMNKKNPTQLAEEITNLTGEQNKKSTQLAEEVTKLTREQNNLYTEQDDLLDNITRADGTKINIDKKVAEKTIAYAGQDLSQLLSKLVYRPLSKNKLLSNRNYQEAIELLTSNTYDLPMRKNPPLTFRMRKNPLSQEAAAAVINKYISLRNEEQKLINSGATYSSEEATINRLELQNHLLRTDIDMFR